ncbi:MAG: serine/threonine-protein kinase [Acidobacteriota bacterium]
MTYSGAASQSSLVGSTIDNKVRLEGILGQGGMGAVYRGRHLLLERTVAVKVLRPEILTVGGSLERFFREARTAAATEHPNIVTVYDFGKLPNGGAYLILEFVEGKNLRNLLQEEGVLSPSLALPILREVCAAVEFAHCRNIIHRDLKPDNIMLKRRDDGTATVKVLDFGLAKTVEEAESSSSITRTGEMVGTPAYMSPEHCSGEALDARSDLYSLGVIAYEMLVGRPPFLGRVAAILTAQIQKPPTPLRELNPNIPPALEEATLAALAKNPHDRPESVAKWWNCLEAAYVAAYGVNASPTIPLSLPKPAPFKAPDDNTTPVLAVTPSREATLQSSKPEPAEASQESLGGTVFLGDQPDTSDQVSPSSSSLSHIPTPSPPRIDTGTLAIGAVPLPVPVPPAPVPNGVTLQTRAIIKGPESRSKRLQRLGIVGGIAGALLITGLTATSWMRSATPVTSPVEKPATTQTLPVTTEPPSAPPSTNLPVETVPVAPSPANTPTGRPGATNEVRDEAAAPVRPSPPRPRAGVARTEPPSSPGSKPSPRTTDNPRTEERQSEKREKRRFWEFWKIGRDKNDKDKPRRPRD